MSKSHFEDHLNRITGMDKSASASKVTPSLLDKLAEELAGGSAGAVDATSKAAVSADADPSAAAAAVVAATDAIVVKQTTIAGGDQTEKEKGETSPAAKGTNLDISAGDGKVTHAIDLNKEPAAVAKAAEGAGNAPAGEKTASDKEAEQIGRTMARSYVDEMKKIATDNAYPEALEILKTAGLLEGYDIKDSIEKTAGETETALDKIAALKPLQREDIVAAAQEYVELQKQASDADAYGREEARKYFAGLVKQAEEESKAEMKKEEKDEEKKEDKKEKETEKKASDEAVAKAVQFLVAKGVIKA